MVIWTRECPYGPMANVDCFDLLMAFHCKIYEALVPLAQAIDTLEAGGQWTPSLHARIHEFKRFHEIDVTAHTRDEEIAFYPIVNQHWRESHPRETIYSPTMCMLQEHADIAGRIHAMAVLADLLQQQPDNALAIENLVGEGRAILAIFPMHIQKEEQYLFAQARKFLPPDDIALATQLIQKLHQE